MHKMLEFYIEIWYNTLEMGDQQNNVNADTDIELHASSVLC